MIGLVTQQAIAAARKAQAGDAGVAERLETSGLYDGDSGGLRALASLPPSLADLDLGADLGAGLGAGLGTPGIPALRPMPDGPGSALARELARRGWSGPASCPGGAQ